MAKRKPVTSFADEITSAEPPPQPDGDIGSCPTTPDAELLAAIRDNDEEAILAIRRPQDWPRESIDILRLCVEEHDRLMPIAESCAGAWQRVLPLDREIAMVKRIDPTSLKEAHELPVKLEELRGEVHREIQRACKGRAAACTIMAIRQFAPAMFSAEAVVPCDPFVECEESTPAERLRLSTCGSPALYLPANINAALRELGLDGSTNDWQTYRRPSPTPQRKRYRLVPGGGLQR